MEKKEIESRLKNAVADIVPDNKEEIIARCHREQKSDTIISFPSKTLKKQLRFFQILSAVALLFIVGSMALSVAKDRAANKVETIIDIDVNPSIELKINKDDKVVAVVAVNDDAKEILDGMDLVGTQTKVAINAIMGSMISHGYFEEEERSILVSVESKASSKAKAVRKQEVVATEIEEVLDTYSVEAKVITQTMEHDIKQSNMADEYGISEGKATLIAKIRELDQSQAEDELALMSINELADLLVTLEDEHAKLLLAEDDKKSDEISDKSQNDDKSSDDKLTKEDGKDKDSSLDSKKEDNKPSVSDNSASDNAVSDNAVSDNSVSDNSISDNSISDNSISDNEVRRDKKVNNEEKND